MERYRTKTLGLPRNYSKLVDPKIAASSRLLMSGLREHGHESGASLTGVFRLTASRAFIHCLQITKSLSWSNRPSISTFFTWPQHVNCVNVS